jgi:D-alanyl-D-alanine carboxypeptidase/D-alanyl-D-alanine-endopeptidase (penicillin-binding protein 4)
VFAFCILHSAFVACAKAPPTAPAPASRPASASAPAPAPGLDPLQQLRHDIDLLVDRPGHLYGTWGVVVESLATDERLYERNPRTLMVPASAMKVVSLATAVEAVGWDYRYQTRLLATGPIEAGVLRGDLVVVGGGDPSVLGRPETGVSRPWVDALRTRGVTRVEGRVIGDDDDVEEPKPGFGWSWEDMGHAYGAMPGALNLGENVTTLIVSPGNAAGLPTIVEVDPAPPGAAVLNSSVTSAPGTPRNAWPELRPGEPALRVHGSIPAGSAPLRLTAAAGNPTLWFARVVRNDLLSAGIDVAGPAVDADDLAVKPDRAAATLIHTHESPPLSVIAGPLLKESINLYAEGVLWLATGPEGQRTTDAALDAARARLESWGIPKDGIQIVDGSGLSRRDVVAAETLVAILRRFHDPAGASAWMQAFPIGGRDGSLEHRLKGTPAEGNAIAKTGSMSNIRTLAGYVRTADGEPLAFAILANNFEGPAPGVTATIDAIVARLAAFHRAESRN